MKKSLTYLAIFLIFPMLLHGCGGGGGGGCGGGSALAGGFLAQQVSAGDFHTCAVQSSGTVKCWGDNSFGQLGDGSGFSSALPVMVVGLPNPAVEVSAGGGHSCARLNDGTVQCWGDNSFGQLGNGTTLLFPTPFPVFGITGATPAIAISAGENHTCAVFRDGTVQCWGLNSSGQLGDGTTATSLTPVPVSGITGATPGTTAIAVSAGGSHTCALFADGSVSCWGDNTFGQLGNGASFTDHPPAPGFSDTPIQTNLLGAAATALAAGANHACAVMSDNTVRCWGDDTFGQIGIPYTLVAIGRGGFLTLTFSDFPVTVTNISPALGVTALGITAGSRHSCANLAGGGVECWGDDSSGQLGNCSFFGGEPVDPLNLPNTTWLPVTTSVLTTATQVDAGSFHTCARLSDSVIACWGDNSSGQLGTGNFNTSDIPLGVVD